MSIEKTRNYSRPLNIYKNLGLEKIEEGTDDYKTFEARKKYIKNNTTFVIPGHNIKLFAVLASETLLKNCKVDEKQIFYFDDKSTDGTREELEKRGFNVMTWDEETYSEFINSEYNDDLPIRVNQIVVSAYKQINTRYICFLDGDLFCLKDLTDYLLTYICMQEYIRNEEFAIFGNYKPKPGYSKDGVCPPQWDAVWQCFLWMDSEFLKNNNLFTDNTTSIKEYLSKYSKTRLDPHFDTGCLLYQNLSKISTLNTIFLSDSQIEKELTSLLSSYTLHMSGLSSAMREDIHSFDNTITVKNMKSCLTSQKFINLCKEFDVNPHQLKLDFFTNFRKTPLTD